MLKLYLLGPPRIELDGEPVDIRRRKALALLIYLAVTGQPHSRDALATLFYPDLDQRQARAYFRRDLGALNTHLQGDWLVADREVVGLNRISEVWSDIAQFQACLASRRAHNHADEVVCPECLPLLTTAATLYADDFLAGFSLSDCPDFDDWQFFEAEGLRQALALVLERLVHAGRIQETYEAVLPFARRWVKLDPLHEPAQRELIQLYHQTGQSTAALRQYEVYAELLDQELGIPPDEETITLYEAIKANRTLKRLLPIPPSVSTGQEVSSSKQSNIKQAIRFATAPDGVRLAYAITGAGPPLVKVANWLSHLEFEWQSPVWRHWLAGLSHHHTLVRYDERGCGLSDWAVDNFSLEAWVCDLETIADAAGLERFPLLGISQGVSIAIAYAIRHPEKVSRLILYGGYARGRLKRDLTPRQLEEAQTFIQLIKLGWGQENPAFRQVFTTLFMPDATLEQQRAFNELQRISSSPENAMRLVTGFNNIDVRHLAPQITAPTLVLHAKDDALTHFAESQLIVDLIPNVRFVPLESKNHILLEDEPAWQHFLNEVHQFLAED